LPVVWRLRHELAAQFPSALALEGLALEIISLVERRSDRRHPPAWLPHAIELSHIVSERGVRLTEVARQLGVHPTHFARTFRLHTGRTFGEHLREHRLAAACRALRSSTQPLAEIAVMAGFADQSHMTRTFRRLLGTTPRVYRSTR